MGPVAYGPKRETSGVLYTTEGPDLEQMRLIAVELAVRPDSYNPKEWELEMFACQHTIPYPQAQMYDTSRRPEARVTIHTSHGDRTMRILL